MSDDRRAICPIPHVGYCIYQRCNFWDDEHQDCSGLCWGDYTSLEAVDISYLHSSCIIYWTEDFD